MNLIESYNNNTIWSELVQTRFTNSCFWIKELENFSNFLDTIIQETQNNTISWNNTFVPLKKMHHLLSYINNFILYTQNSHGHKNVITEKFNTIYSDFHSKISSPEILGKLTSLLKTVNQKNKKQFLIKWLKDLNLFRTTQKDIKYNHYYQKLQQKIANFETHNLNLKTNLNYSLFIPFGKKELLDGLSLKTLAVGSTNAKAKNKKGWLFYINNDNIHNFLENAQNRKIRAKIYSIYQKVDDSQNHKLIKDILFEKQKIAQVLNKENYAELNISGYKLNTPQKVLSYLSQVEKETLASKEFISHEVTKLAKKDNLLNVKVYDFPFYFKKIKNKMLKTNSNISFNLIYSLERIILYFQKKFHVKFTLLSQIRKNVFIYHIVDLKSDLKSYLILNFSNGTSGCFEADISLKTKISNDFDSPLIQYIELDFFKKNINFHELSYLVHEFGHAFHGFFNNKIDSTLTNELSWDLIEAPSQFLEFLIYDYDFIQFISPRKIYYQDFLSFIQKQIYFDKYYTYQTIKKQEIIFKLFLDFKPYSNCNIHKEIAEKMAENQIIYNISQDSYMSYENHLNDYAPTGFIYLFSAQIAFSIFQKSNDYRKVYQKLFNNNNNIKINKNLLHSDNFFHKNLPIEILS